MIAKMIVILMMMMRMMMRMMIPSLGGTYFEEYGALMKAWNNDWRPDRWYC